MAPAEHAAPRWASLVDALQHQARVRPDRTALVFLPDGETEVGRLTHADLDRRARAFAAQLQQQGLQGRAVLLMLPSSLYYAVAFVGCLYAGAIPVPAYPPTSSMHAERMAHVVADCQAHGAIVATSSALHGIGERLRQRLPGGLDCRLIAIDGMDAAQPDQRADWQPPVLHRDSTAYLQYTSGSTSQPRGVVVTHGNLLSYVESYTQAAAVDDSDVFVSWLPLFHDMGLILGLLQGLLSGATVVMMPPLAFLQKPLRWLQAISRYRGTVSYAPNFAYELCASTLDQALVNTLDLSCWSVAGNAAEPVHAGTLARFARRFERCGFRPAAMNPSYGLAEATLTVSSHPRLQAPRVIDADPVQLAAGRVAPPQPGARLQQLVSCGRPWLDTALAIVDPLTHETRGDGEVGEIWVAGSLVARGYWQRAAESEESFGARTADGRGPWLRTGDLGVLLDGELCVTGRLKDLIIIRGQNHHPQDIEHTVQRAHPALEIGHGAAFAVELDGQERLVVVQEVRRSQRQRLDGEQVVQAIRAAVAEAHGLQVHAVQLLRPASVHITSSGKIQRRACRQTWLEGGFEVLHAWQETPPEHGRSDNESSELPVTTAEAIAGWLVQQLAERLRRAPHDVDRQQAFSAMGLDSLQLTALSAALGRWLGRPVDPVLLYSHPSIDALARHLAGAAPAAASARPHIAAAEPVAVIGLACRFPGAGSAEAYWQLLDQGIDAITEIPASRWNGDARYQPGPPAPGKASTKWGGFLDEVDRFDAHFFGISPREAAGMDPQQRLLLQASWHALEDAGIAPDALAGSATGVFIGAMTHDYESLQLTQHAALDAYFGTGTHASILANRISYQFDLRGPSWVAETACSSSLVALHGARLSLQAGECSLALVGGVNCLLAPELFTALSQAQMLSPDGRCMSFDARANGYVRSEGCAVLVLKRLADAQRDGDRVYGVVRGSAVNQDGRSNGLTAPSAEAQQAVIRQALAVSATDASEVGYVEAHGTGTSLGDPIEMDALRCCYGQASAAQPTLWIGSAKSQIGHTEPVSGLAGLAKVLLALQHQRLPGNLHFQQLNPHIDLQGSRCAVLAQAQPWPRAAAPRVAAVSSFGFGGANAHVIVADAPVPAVEAAHAAQPGQPAPPPQSPQPLQFAQPALRMQAAERADSADGAVPQLLTVSAKTPAALRRRALQLAGHLEQQPGDAAGFHALCHTTNAHRAHLGHRLAVVAGSAAQAAAALREQAGQVGLGAAPAAPPGRVALLFTGQGAQYDGMGAALYRTHRLFRRQLDRCDELLRPLLQGRSLVRGLYGSAEERFDLRQTMFAQPALFAVEHALASVWLAAGLKPDCLIGHSLGEIAAACVAGVFSLEDALTLVAHRGRLMQHGTPPGAMVALRGDEVGVQRCIDELSAERPANVALAARNAPGDIVISGDPGAVAAWITHWTSGTAVHELQATPLPVERAFHSPLMAGMLDEFAAVVRAMRLQPPQIDVVSNLSGEPAGGRLADPAYWVEHVRQPVEFARGLLTLSRSGCTVFVEIGPHPVLSAFGRQVIEGGTWLASLRRGEEADRQLLASLGDWHVAGGRVDWAGWARARSGPALPRPVSLPPYPFEPDRHWFTPGRAPAGQPSAVHPLLGRRLPLARPGEHRFHGPLHGGQPWFIDEHRVAGVPVMPLAGFIEAALAAARHGTVDAMPQWTVRDLALQGALALPAGHAAELQCVVTPAEAGGQGRALLLLARTRAVADDSAEGGAAVDDAAAADAADAAGAAAWTAWRPLARAHAAATGLPPAPPLDLPALQRALVEQPVHGLYAQAAAIGLDYGPGLQGLRRLWLGPAEALAHIDMPARVRHDGGYHLHPATLDACFHAAIPFMAQALQGRPLVLVPTALARLTVHRPLPAEAWVHCRWHGETAAGHCTADLDIHALDGACVASIEGLALAPTHARSLTESAAEEPLRLQRVQWLPLSLAPAPSLPAALPASPQTLPPAAPSAAAPGAADVARRPWLIACPQPALALQLRQQALQAGEAAFVVHAGAGFAMSADTAQLDWHSESQWQLLFQQLRLRRLQPAGLIYHANDAAAAPAPVPDAVDARARAVLLACQQFLLSHAEHDPAVLILTRGAQVPADAALAGQRMESAGLAQCAEAAMARTITPEFPRVRCVHVDLDPGAPDDEVPLQRVFDLLRATEGSAQFALRGPRCLEARLRELPAATWPLEDVTLRADASYLVTGGLRGLGLATAQWLVERGARCLVLVGRTGRGGCDAAAEATLRQLEARGARVHCHAADVADRAALAALLAGLQDRLPPLRGIFHAAGLTDDAALARMDAPRLRRALAPKVSGAWHLHELTQDLPLDHFVLYSSQVSLLGNAGQWNYGAGCGFLDALAAYRRHRGLAGVSINWGWWSETGLATGRDLHAHMDRLGIGGITTAQGLQALQRLVAAQPVQCGAATIDWDRWRAAAFPVVPCRWLAGLGGPGGTRGAATAAAAAPPPPAVDWPSLLPTLPSAQAREQLLAYLLDLVCRILRLGAEARQQVERDFARTPLNQLGFDSLMAVELRNRIRRDTGADVPLKHVLAGSSAADVVRLILSHSLLERMAAPAASADGLPDAEMETIQL